MFTEKQKTQNQQFYRWTRALKQKKKKERKSAFALANEVHANNRKHMEILNAQLALW